MKELDNINREHILDIVTRLDFFSNFSIQEKKLIVDLKTKLYTYDKGEYLIHDGSSDTSFFILLKGSVSVSKGDNQKPFAKLSAGDSFGEIAFITETPRTANVIAEEQVIVIKIDRITFDRFDINIREKFKDNFILKLVERLNRMNNAYVNRWS